MLLQVLLNVLANLSLWCDCAGYLAPEHKINDMGILASTDTVAIDRACLDMIVNHVDVGTEELLDQIQNLAGENTIFVAERHKIGSQEYNFINITDETDQYDDDEESNITLIIILYYSYLCCYIYSCTCCWFNFLFL